MRRKKEEHINVDDDVGDDNNNKRKQKNKYQANPKTNIQGENEKKEFHIIST